MLRNFSRTLRHAHVQNFMKVTTYVFLNLLDFLGMFNSFRLAR